MKGYKKVFAVLLSLWMAIGCLPLQEITPVYAEEGIVEETVEEPDTTSEPQEETIEPVVEAEEPVEEEEPQQEIQAEAPGMSLMALAGESNAEKVYDFLYQLSNGYSYIEVDADLTITDEDVKNFGNTWYYIANKQEGDVDEVRVNLNGHNLYLSDRTQTGFIVANPNGPGVNRVIFEEGTIYAGNHNLFQVNNSSELVLNNVTIKDCKNNAITANGNAIH